MATSFRVGRNQMSATDLDVDSPEKVSIALDNAAQAYRESAGELASSWQDRNAGRVWLKIAAELEKLAPRIDKIVEKYW